MITDINKFDGRSIMSDVFLRNEKKYLLDEAKYRALMSVINEYMREDDFGKYCVESLYYDTRERELIYNSISKPVFKEKLRLRFYQQPSRITLPTRDSEVFMELKRKFNGVVYKRRAAMTLAQAESFIATGVFTGECKNEQILNELRYFVNFYRLEPAMFIACDRRAYHCPTDSKLRMTLDSNIRYRADSSGFRGGACGTMLLSPSERLLEIKTGDAMPMWLSNALDSSKIYPQTYSKYGNAFKMLMKSTCNMQAELSEKEGGTICA